MSELRDLLRLFNLAKNAWNSEERKHLLTEDKREEIDQHFFEVEHILNSFRNTERDRINFLRTYSVLRASVSRAEIKMGYISL